jgi:subtilisin family serine protease
MRKNMTVRVILILGLLLVLLPAAAGAAPKDVPVAGAGTIDQFALDQLAANGRANVFVKLASDADLSAAEGVAGRVARRQYVYDTLTAHAASSQKALTAYLDGRGVRYQSFWINNSLYLYDVDLALVRAVARRADVAYIRGDSSVPLIAPVSQEPSPDLVAAIEWGVMKINADDVWLTGNTGQGIVVANNDTGVRYTHEAVNAQYRGNNGGGNYSHDYNWWDPQSGNPGSQTPAPVDNNGHGTHTMGTMVGGDASGPLVNDVGVAPGAKWIAAKGCASSSCSNFDLISSAQWLACPTDLNGQNPICSMAPDVVNNSWGGGGGDPWYNSYVNSWISAGIIPVFSAGNSGPSCATMGSPGDYKQVIGVGATNINDVLASFSSRGPGSFRVLKPDFVAPGENVRSSYNTSDTSYANLSGTSMAAPHTVGTIALMLHANPSASLIQIYNALRTTTFQGLGNPPNPDSCSGRDYTVYPNFHYGWGRIDAAAAVTAIAP